jgi:hypothetical protein
MDATFADLVNKYPECILIYMDDVLICSDNLEELQEITHAVLTRENFSYSLKHQNATLKRNKSSTSVSKYVMER